jgi:hypothetical protein
MDLLRVSTSTTESTFEVSFRSLCRRSFWAMAVLTPAATSRLAWSTEVVKRGLAHTRCRVEAADAASETSP